MNIVKSRCTFVVLLTLAISRETMAASNEALLEEMIGAFNRREALIKTIGFDYHYVKQAEAWLKDEGLDTSIAIRVRHEGHKRMVHLQPHNHDNREVIYGFDGKRSITLGRSEEARDEYITRNGLSNHLLTYMSPVSFISENLDGRPYSSMVRNGKVSASMVGKEARLSVVLGDDVLEYEYFFDPAKDYALVRFNTKMDGKLSKRGTIVSAEMIEIDGGKVQVVTEGKVEVFHHELGKLSYVESITVDRYEINEEYADDLFTPKMNSANRTSWWDADLQKGMILNRKEDEMKEVADVTLDEVEGVEEDSVSLEEEVTSNPWRPETPDGYPPPPSPAVILARQERDARWWRYGYVLSGGAAVLIALLARRRWSGKKQKPGKPAK